MEEQNTTKEEREKLHQKEIEDKVKAEKTKKVVKKVAIYGGIVLIIAVIIYFGVAGANKPSKYDDFAKCLSNKGAIFYGSFQCSHCLDQKELFGKSIKYVNYIECGPLGGPQNQICIDAGIKAYPTWKIGNETTEGVLTLNDLSDSTGCVLPQ